MEISPQVSVTRWFDKPSHSGQVCCKADFVREEDAEEAIRWSPTSTR